MQGRIKTYNEDRAFGFILGEDGEDYFFHASNWKSIAPIIRGSTVSFTPGEAEKGKVATKIELIAKKPEFVSFGPERLKLSNIKTYGISQDNTRSICTGEVIVYELTTLRFRGLLGKTKYVKNCLCPSDERIIVKSREDFSVRGKSYVRITVHNATTQKDEMYDTKIIKTKNGNIRGLNANDGSIYNEKGEVISIGPIDGFYDGKRLDSKDFAYRSPKYLYVTTFQNTNYQWFEDSSTFDIHEKCKELDQYLGVEKL